MAEPFLDFGDIGLVVERVSGDRRAQRMDAGAVDLGIDASRAAIFAHNVVMDGVVLAEVIEQGGESRELAANGRGRQVARR